MAMLQRTLRASPEPRTTSPASGWTEMNDTKEPRSSSRYRRAPPWERWRLAGIQIQWAEGPAFWDGGRETMLPVSGQP